MKQHLLKNSFLRGVLCLLLCVTGIGNAYGQKYQLITRTDSLITGKKYLIASMQYGQGFVMKEYDGSSNNWKHVQSSASNSCIKYQEGMAGLTLGGNANAWTFRDSTYYMDATSEEENYLKGSKTIGTYSKFNISFSGDNVANIKCKGDKEKYSLQYNSDSKLFSCYTSEQKPVYLYKEMDFTLSISDNYEPDSDREYYVGDTLTADNLVVTAIYSKDDNEIVTNEVKWSFEPEIITSETKSVKATATYGGKSIEYTYNITNKGEKTIRFIHITGEPTTTRFHAGEKPSSDGLSVIATYNNNTTIDVTAYAVWSFTPETINSETTEVTATAKYTTENGDEMTATKTFAVNIVHNYTLDLSTNSYSSSTEQTVKWDAVVASMTLSKGEGTYNANHYLGGSELGGIENKETSFYKGHKINITPKATIDHIIFTTTDDTFTTNLLASTYTNATRSQDGNSNNIVITPTNGDNDISITMAGQCKCTSMTIYYLPIVSILTDAGYATLCLPYNATVPDGLTAYTATDNGENIKLTAKEGDKIAAKEGVVLKGDEGTYTFVATEGSVSPTAGNQMVGVTKDTEFTEADNAYILTRKKDDGSIAFRLLKTNYTLGANKAYLKVDGSANTRELIPAIWDDNATGIEKTTENNATNIIYNLAGQKLTHIQKGVNIINGKLIVK